MIFAWVKNTGYFKISSPHWIICNDFCSVSVSRMSGDELILGRPYGGCMIFFGKSFSHSISRLKSCWTHFCALLLKLLNSSHQRIVSILIVNVYLPTNYGSDESTSTFRETVAELEGFLLSLTYDHVITAGDILLKSALIALSLSTSCKPLISLGVIHVLISHSHTDAMITSPFPGLMMLFVLQLFWTLSVI